MKRIEIHKRDIVLFVFTAIIVLAIFGCSAYLNGAGGKAPADMEFGGAVYTYNRNTTNVLLLGVDYMTGNTDKSVGHQADTILLLSMDKKNNKTVLIDIPRDTLTQVAQYDMEGNFARNTVSPIAIAHSFGRDEAQSAGYTREAVSYFLYGVPIQSYISLNIDGVTVANDMVGGVPLTAMEDFSMVDPAMQKGADVVLTGERALQYVRERSLPGMSGSNLDRMQRQIQYMKAFLGQLKEKTKQDIRFPIAMLEKMAGYVSTDMNSDEFAAMVQELLSAEAEELDIRTIAGAAQENGFSADQEELKNLIREIFYSKKS